MMMFYRRRTSPKLCDDMTEVEYGGGGHRTRLKVEYGGGGHRTRLKDPRDQFLCLWGAPSSVYKGARGRPADPFGRAKEEESSS